MITYAESLVESRFPEVNRALFHELSAQYFKPDLASDEGSICHSLGIGDETTPIEIDVDPVYARMVAKARKRVLIAAIEREIVIEVCPTSNLLIGGFGRYSNLPYLNLHRAPLPAAPEGCEAEPGWEDEFDPRIPISINSDDPGTFHTNIESEYRLMGLGLVEAGYRRQDVVAWLQQARETGLHSSFIPRWNPVTRPEMLDSLRRLLSRA